MAKVTCDTCQDTYRPKLFTVHYTNCEGKDVVYTIDDADNEYEAVRMLTNILTESFYVTSVEEVKPAKTHRHFRVWSGFEKTVEMPASATNKECQEACEEALENIDPGEEVMNSGWEEV